MDRPQYVNWIVREDGVVFEDQQPLNCYRLSYVRDDAILDDWALHIRKQYVPDGELEEDAALNKLTVEEYLRQYIIPQKGEPFGPTARSNDISEILFADLFEFILNYEVPRCKQHNRSGKNESEHGTDIIAYRFFAEGKAPHKNDELVAIEVKALLSSNEAGKVIKDAVIVHYLRSSFFRSVFDDSNSTAINQLTQDMLKRAIVPLPPLSEQRRIVEAIGAMLFELNQIEKSLS